MVKVMVSDQTLVKTVLIVMIRESNSSGLFVVQVADGDSGMIEV